MDIPKVIGSVMQPLPFTVPPDETIKEVRGKMGDLGVRHLPVVDGLQILGVISDRDMANLDALETEWSKGSRELLASDICTIDTYTVDTMTPLGNVLESMIKNRVGSALVTDNGELVGIFTTTDACMLLLDLVNSCQ